MYQPNQKEEESKLYFNFMQMEGAIAKGAEPHEIRCFLAINKTLRKIMKNGLSYGEA